MVMPMRSLLLLLTVGLGQVAAQTNVDFANLREDVRVLTQQVGALTLRLEELERENARLRSQASQITDSNYATVAQLNEAVAELNKSLRTAVSASRSETLDTVSKQMERLAQQTDAALQALARGQAARPAAQTAFSDNYPKEGVSYTVQKGDTLAIIARKTGAKVHDIINANKISDPSKIQAGQALFIPGAK